MLIAKIAFLFLGILFTLVNTTRLIGREADILASNFILQAIGITGFAALQWLM